ncbi:NAD(P)H dehydrogenase (quinone) [Rhizobium sp. RU20A]|uniref:SDR family oxidoreductase n=1 Tax=Rhizobium sp. RU20A TaxID=1907412 RepID=UPI000955381B|nr:SDR family oxidoreductase [Rhizobium sp. RU20A]SIQ17802.1 NAD(P)H dehydrogenase (quinone) [Rhizobium sp. RU20A]
MGKTILVTGASGQFGRLVIENLLASGKVDASDIIAGSRHTAKLADLAARGVQTRTVDFDAPAETLSAAFAGVDTLLIISTDALDANGTRLKQHKAAIAAAKAAGVGHIAYTSMPNAETSLVTFAPDHLGTEAAIKESGIPHTILRNSWYVENLFLSLPAALASGTWYTSAGEGKTPYIARADLAAAAAGALLIAGAESRTYTLTGDKAYTNREIAALVTAITGKPIAVVDLDDDSLAAGLSHAGVPEAFIPTFVSFDRNTREKLFDIVTDDVRTLSGRAPQSLERVLEASKAAFGA